MTDEVLKKILDIDGEVENTFYRHEKSAESPRIQSR